MMTAVKRAVPLLMLVGLVACSSLESARRALDAAARDATRLSTPLPVVVQTIEGEEQARISLTWPEPVAVRSTTDARSLLLRFGRAFSAPDIESVPRRLGGWVDAVHAGPDSLVVRAALDVNFWVVVDGAVVTLRLVRRPAEPGETVIIGGGD